MGGIVAAETILSISRDQPIRPSTPDNHNDEPELPFMFPSILGLLAFDTPYLGISPGVIAHGAESHYQNIKGVWSAYNTVSSVFGGGAAAAAAAEASKSAPPPPSPPPGKRSNPRPPSANDPDTATVPAWQRWGRYAMYAGAAGAIIAGGAAAYANRQQFSEGWNWATSHLQFVGCLAKGAELEARVAALADLRESRGLCFLNLFTQLGRDAGTLTWRDESAETGGTTRWGDGGGAEKVAGPKVQFAHRLAGGQRTFCMLPKTEARRALFEGTVNDVATSEIAAHMGMFVPRENPGYYMMSERVKEVLVGWVTKNWPVVVDEDTHLGAESPEVVDERDAVEEPEVVDKDEAQDMHLTPHQQNV
jgi:hypothetical protein